MSSYIALPIIGLVGYFDVVRSELDSIPHSLERLAHCFEVSVYMRHEAVLNRVVDRERPTSR